MDRSVALIERLLADPELRARFRGEPEAVCRQHDLPEMAAELAAHPRELTTLDNRESRSSLAGVILAAAAEGVDFSHFAALAAPGMEKEAAATVHRVLDGLSAPAHHVPARAVVSPEFGAPPGRPGALPPLAAPSDGQSRASDPVGGVLARPDSAAAADAARSVASDEAGAADPSHDARIAADRRIRASSALPADARTPAAAAPGTEAHPDVIAGNGPAGLRHIGTDLDRGHAEALAIVQDLGRYPGDDAPPRRLAGWMAMHAARAGLPPELPVMAALTESALRNTPTGDRDSVGFFQMRTSIWDSGPYAGFERRPRLQLQWFIDQALAVRGSHADDPSFGRDPSSWGSWIADVEQPAIQYRGRYQLQLDAARELLRGLDLATPASPPPADAAVRTALQFVGAPYVWGGSSPATGFDCSGLVQYAFSRAGIDLPRVAADQFATGTPIARAELSPGDVVFFRDPGGTVHHEGIYLGGGMFVHAPRTGEDIKVSSLDEPYFVAQYTGARRFSPAPPMGDTSNYARSLPTISD